MSTQRRDRNPESAVPAGSPDYESRFPRRLLFATAAAGLTGAAVVGGAAPAEAADPATSWKLGGNAVSNDGKNFIGSTTSYAPIVFKTKYYSTSAVTEKMRLTANGRLGLGTTAPGAKLDATATAIVVRGVSTSSDISGRGVVGSAPGGYGVEGTSTNNIGVHGTGGYCGVWGETGEYGVIGSGASVGVYAGGGPYGVFSSGTTYGVYGTGPTGVYGTGATGVSGYSTDTNGAAVYGNGGQFGVRGVNGRTAGVRGDSGYVGVWGEAPTYAVYANATATSGQTYGVYANNPNAAGYAVFAQGRMHVNGTLSKSAGSFRIDHPLDPANKWLSHSFVESPDMLNVYNGRVTTDDAGFAAITLPDYFSALNRDPQYQLTVIGAFAQTMVSKEIEGNSFEIMTDKPGITVSWQVTGIRNDTYAQEHPIEVESEKSDEDKAQTSSANRGGTPTGLGPISEGDSIMPDPATPPAAPTHAGQ